MWHLYQKVFCLAKFKDFFFFLKFRGVKRSDLGIRRIHLDVRMPDKAGPDQQVIALYQISDDLKGYNADKKKWDVSRRIRIDEVKNKWEEQELREL